MGYAAAFFVDFVEGVAFSVSEVDCFEVDCFEVCYFEVRCDDAQFKDS